MCSCWYLTDSCRSLSICTRGAWGALFNSTSQNNFNRWKCSHFLHMLAVGGRERERSHPSQSIAWHGANPVHMHMHNPSHPERVAQSCKHTHTNTVSDDTQRSHHQCFGRAPVWVPFASRCVPAATAAVIACNRAAAAAHSDTLLQPCAQHIAQQQQHGLAALHQRQSSHLRQQSEHQCQCSGFATLLLCRITCLLPTLQTDQAYERPDNVHTIWLAHVDCWNSLPLQLHF